MRAVGKFVVPTWVSSEPAAIQLEATKNGEIVDILDLSEKQYYVIGRNKELSTITLEHPSDVGHDGDTRMYRTALRHPPGSKAAEDGFMSAPFWDESGFPWYGDDWAGLVLGADGYPTIIVYSVDESVREDRRRRRRKSRRRRSPSRR